MEFLLLAIGLAGLWFGTELTIRGAIGIAERLRVPEFIIGLAILSIGSDLPELAIAINAAIENLQTGETSDVVVGSALGSGLAQIGLVLGLSALVHHLSLPRKMLYRHGGIMLGSLLLLAVFALDGYISALEGAALLVFYLIYLLMLLARNDDEDLPLDTHPRGNIAGLSTLLIIGLTIIAGSAELTVASATDMAIRFGVEQSLIAILLIGLGSSLPELAISIVAAVKRRAHLSIGNLIGSNIFDTLVPIGAAAMISGLSFDAGMLRFELPLLFALSVMVLLFFKTHDGIRKREAWGILGFYFVYAAIKLAQM